MNTSKIYLIEQLVSNELDRLIEEHELIDAQITKATDQGLILSLKSKQKSLLGAIDEYQNQMELIYKNIR